MEYFFWFYMTAMSLLVPWVMHVFGKYYQEDPPRERNASTGYRTKRSMQNEQTWAFAHEYFGRIIGYMGPVLMVVAMLSMVMVWGKDTAAVVIQSLAVIGLEFVFFIAAMLQTERALKKTFGKRGTKDEVGRDFKGNSDHRN